MAGRPEGSQDAARRAGARRLGPVPLALVLVGVAVVVAVLRVRAAVEVQQVWGEMPDSAGYRPRDGGPVTSLVSLTGTAVRPWTVPAFYAFLPSDGWRAAGQLLVSIAAWTALAAAVARQVVRPWLAAAGFVAVLVLSCSWGVILWDLAILAESLALSLGVALLAAWIEHLRRSTWASAAVVVVVSALWLFTRLQHLPVVAGSAALALLALLWASRPAAPPAASRPRAGAEGRAGHPARGAGRGGRAVRVATAVGLLVVTAWGLATLGRQDDGYAARDGHGVSLFGETFALNLRFVILPDPEATEWFLAQGMPRPVGLEGHPRAGTIHDDAWETWKDWFARYRADTELRAWVESEGRSTFTAYVLQHAGTVGGRFATEIDDVLVPPGTSLGYAFPEPILPRPIEAVVAPQAGDGLPSPAVTAAAAVVLATALRRRWFPNRVLATVGAAAVAASFAGLFLAWLGSPVEYARHAVPFTAGLVLGLVLLLLGAVDGGSPPAADPACGGMGRGSGRRRGRGGPPLAAQQPVAEPDARRPGGVEAVGS